MAKSAQHLDPDREWMPRYHELIESKHLREQAERAYEPYVLIRGRRDSLSLEGFVEVVARLVALVEVTGERQTANDSGVVVVRGPMEGYGILLHAADAYVLHLGDLRDGDSKFRRAQELWARQPKPRQVWTLTVDSSGIVTTLHNSESAALDALRTNYDPEGDLADVADGDLLQTLIDTLGLEIYLERHDLPEA